MPDVYPYIDRPVQQPAVWQQDIQRIEEVLNAIEKYISVLADKLDQVLGSSYPDATQEATNEKQASRSPLGWRLNAMEEQAKELRYRLRRLLDQVDL